MWNNCRLSWPMQLWYEGFIIVRESPHGSEWCNGDIKKWQNVKKNHPINYNMDGCINPSRKSSFLFLVCPPVLGGGGWGAMKSRSQHKTSNTKYWKHCWKITSVDKSKLVHSSALGKKSPYNCQKLSCLSNAYRSRHANLRSQSVCNIKGLHQLPRRMRRKADRNLVYK